MKEEEDKQAEYIWSESGKWNSIDNLALYGNIALVVLVNVLLNYMWLQSGINDTGEGDFISYYTLFAQILLGIAPVVFFVLVVGRITCPEQLMVNESGITYHKRKFTLRHGLSIWQMETCFYPWSEISKLTFNSYKGSRYLILSDRQMKRKKITLSSMLHSEKEFADAIGECCSEQGLLEEFLVSIYANHDKNIRAVFVGIGIVVIVWIFFILMLAWL